MLRRSWTSAAPVFLHICDKSKVPELRAQARQGVGYAIKFELGEGRDTMQVIEFQRRIDDFMKKRSQVFGTVVGGKVTTSSGDEVQEVHAYKKYIVSGTMANGYVKQDMKFGARMNGYNGGKLRGGLKWAGSE